MGAWFSDMRIWRSAMPLCRTWPSAWNSCSVHQRSVAAAGSGEEGTIRRTPPVPVAALIGDCPKSVGALREIWPVDGCSSLSSFLMGRRDSSWADDLLRLRCEWPSISHGVVATLDRIGHVMTGKISLCMAIPSSLIPSRMSPIPAVPTCWQIPRLRVRSCYP